MGNNRVLITGASGFCGKHLVCRLKKLNYEVIGTYEPKARAPRLTADAWYRLDILDRNGVSSLVAKLRPGFICHLAAQSFARVAWQKPEKTFAVNVAGTVHLLNAIRKYSVATRMLYISSIQVYGHSFHSGKAVKESDLLWPRDPYGASKTVAELACLDFYNRFGVQVVIARPFNHVGAGQPSEYVLSDWSRQIALAEKKAGKGQAVIRIGNIRHRRDFLHVDDVVCAYEILMRCGRSGESYNVASGKIYSLENFLNYLLKKTAIPFKVIREKSRVQKVVSLMRANADRLRALGWRPKLSPYSAIEELLNEWRDKVESAA